MPISVVCPGCKSRFGVSEKFAGKQGACPKCKTLIKIPTAQEEVKIHAPEPEGPVDSKGRSVLKPILREKTVINPVVVVAVVGAVLASIGAIVAGRIVTAEKKFPPLLAAVVLPLMGAPIAVAGYSVLRDAELEPYRGRALWLRAFICGLVYAALWGAFCLIYWKAPGIFSGHYVWLFIIPPMVALGAAASLATFDLEFGNAALHYTFYLMVTLFLGWAANYPLLWTLIKETQTLAR